MGRDDWSQPGTELNLEPVPMEDKRSPSDMYPGTGNNAHQALAEAVYQLRSSVAVNHERIFAALRDIDRRLMARPTWCSEIHGLIDPRLQAIENDVKQTRTASVRSYKALKEEVAQIRAAQAKDTAARQQVLGGWRLLALIAAVVMALASLAGTYTALTNGARAGQTAPVRSE